MSEDLTLRLTPAMQSALSEGLLFARRILENGEIKARQTEPLQTIVYDTAQPNTERTAYALYLDGYFTPVPCTTEDLGVMVDRVHAELYPNYRREPLGDRTCLYSANSPYLRCAVNPSAATCEVCQHYERT